MKTYGIVAEFNPFHNGHEYLIKQGKKAGAEKTVCVMSGNFVQRGEPAVCSKWRRAEMALKCGADLVVELPVSWAVSSAERFAYGAVSVLNSMGCVDNLLFGCENADSDSLFSAAFLCISEEYSRALKEFLSEGLSFPSAREKAVLSVADERTAEILKTPNNILAVEYCKALLRLNSPISLICVNRTGVDHDSENLNEAFASASAIRKMLSSDYKIAADFMPKTAFELLKKANDEGRLLKDFKNLDLPLISMLRKADASEISLVPDVSEGLEYKIKEAAKSGTSFGEIADLVKSKRYTHSRLRRILLLFYLGIYTKDLIETPPYIRVLGFNSKGRELLSQMKKIASLPVIMRYNDIVKLSGQCKSVFDTESRAVDMYNTLFDDIRPCGENMTHNPIILME